MAYSGDSHMIVSPGINDFLDPGEDANATELVKARVPAAYKRKMRSIADATGMNESEIIRDLIERAVVIKVIRETGVLGVSSNGGGDLN